MCIEQSLIWVVSRRISIVGKIQRQRLYREAVQSGEGNRAQSQFPQNWDPSSAPSVFPLSPSLPALHLPQLSKCGTCLFSELCMKAMMVFCDTHRRCLLGNSTQNMRGMSRSYHQGYHLCRWSRRKTLEDDKPADSICFLQLNKLPPLTSVNPAKIHFLINLEAKRPRMWQEHAASVSVWWLLSFLSCAVFSSLCLLATRPPLCVCLIRTSVIALWTLQRVQKFLLLIYLSQSYFCFVR